MNRALPIVAILLILIVAACGGDTAAAEKDLLVNGIKDNLPAQLEQISGSSVTVGDVSCVDQGGRQYKCIAMVSDGSGSELSVPISASCDDESCEWRAD